MYDSNCVLRTTSLPPSLAVQTSLQPRKQLDCLLFNQQLAEELGIEQQELLNWCSGTLPTDVVPCGAAYAGHQFGQFVPLLGDGRAVLLGEVHSKEGKTFDIQIKGSGKTPFAYRGDGKLALGPALREYIVSESMHRLGIPTTRALALIATGEKVRRDTTLSGALLVRVAPSHLRVGSLQYIALRHPQHMQYFVDYIIQRHCPSYANRYQDFCLHIAEQQATLIAQWMSVGFIHGVMNTDNTSLCGITLDYGPCAFMDDYKSNKVFSSIDTMGRYAYANQPDIGAWNLARCIETLLPLLNEDQQQAQHIGQTIIDHYTNCYNNNWRTHLCQKVGFAQHKEAHYKIATQFLTLLEKHTIDFTVAFHLLTKTVTGNEDAHNQFCALSSNNEIQQWYNSWHTAIKQQGHGQQQIHALMQKRNPVRIARNHQVEAIIKSAYDSDFAPAIQMQQALAHPYQEDSVFADYEAPPNEKQKVWRTFCGT